MIVEGIELNIDSKTLEEWESLSTYKSVQEPIKKLFTEAKDFSYNIPIGYVSCPNRPGWGKPVPGYLHSLLQVLDRHRFQETLNATEANAVAAKKGVKCSIQALHYNFDKIEETLGILPVLPKTIQAKAQNKRMELEWRRKRRVAKRKAKKTSELRAEKRRIEAELKKETTKRIKEAKTSLMTAEEMQGEDIGAKIKALKSEAKESRFTEGAKVTTGEQEVLFEPTPKQAEFLASPEKVVFYGGAAGLCEQL